MAVNKVVINDEVKIDLTSDTVSPDTLSKGITAHDKSGNVIVGTMEGGGSSQRIESSVYTDEINQSRVLYTIYRLYNPRVYGYKILPQLTGIYGELYIDDTCEKLSPLGGIQGRGNYFYNIRFPQNENFTTIPYQAIYGLLIDMGLEIVIPDNVTKLENSAFYNLSKRYTRGVNEPTTFKMSANLEELSHSFEGRADGKLILDFSRATKVPTLLTTSLCDRWKPSGYSYYLCTLNKIIVPDELYNEWTTATNWSYWNSSSSATAGNPDGKYFVKASEVTE